MNLPQGVRDSVKKKKNLEKGSEPDLSKCRLLLQCKCYSRSILQEGPQQQQLFLGISLNCGVRKEFAYTIRMMGVYWY
jgi:hypothetical protein